MTLTFDKAVDFGVGGGTLRASLSDGATVTLASTDASGQSAFRGINTVGDGEADSPDSGVASLSLTGGATLIACDDGVPADLSIPDGRHLADSVDVAIDANTRAAPQPDLTAGTDTGTIDNITNDSTLTIAGSTEANASVAVRIGGTTVRTAAVDGTRAWD